MNFQIDTETVGVGNELDLYVSRRRVIRRAKNDFARDVGGPPLMFFGMINSLDNAKIVRCSNV
jgi:hypothetical protein